MKKSVFVFWLAVFGFAASIGFAQSFPAGFQGTWKRPQYASTLSFTGNTVKASNRDVVWTLKSVAGNKYAIVSSSKGATLALTIRLVSGKLEISGDSGKGEANWNGTYATAKPASEATAKQTVARKPTMYVNGKLEIVGDSGAYANNPGAVTFDSQEGSAVAAQTITDGGTVPYPKEPVKEGVFFGGWYSDADCTDPCDYAATVSGPLTLYAKWLTESEMIAGEFGASVPAGNVFEVNNASATAAGQPGWNNSWAKARAAINSGGNGKNYVVKVTGNFQLADSSSSTFTPSNIKVLVYAPANKTISSSGDKGSLLNAGAKQTLILRSITLQGSVVSSTNAHLIMRPGTVVRGVGVSSGGTFTMSGGTISGNSASGVNVGGTFTMSGGTISGNTASGVNVGGTFTMSGGTISGNKPLWSSHNGGGGGVYVSGGTFTMSGGNISGNTASDGGGGGVYVAGGTFTMSGGTISGNKVEAAYFSYGGGVYVGDGTFTMRGGTISGNSAKGPLDGGGGGVYFSGKTFTMSGGTINGNSARYGGGVRVGGGTFTMGDGTVSGNSAEGVHIDKDGRFTMRGGTISGNKTSGVSVGGAFTMSGGTISGSSSGGVSVAGGGTFTMSGGNISGNTASDGGGVYVDSGTFWLRDGTVYGSEAGTGLANTAKSGASLAIKDTATCIAKYGSGGDIIESGLATDATLTGHD
jgi:uncharacterized repeat protein (TIGR02543 family)